jgi:NlpC/P60 family putative phage cell wall peptidase
MTSGERALVEARRWIGTPYVHQASVPGGGADCLGLVRGVWRALYGQEPCAVPPYRPDWAEAGRGEALLQAAEAFLRRKDPCDACLGDVLLFRMRDAGPAKHLGLQSDIGAHPRFIHAYSGHAVTESALSAPWARRIVARFAFPAGDL